jgi:hypothetical protein
MQLTKEQITSYKRRGYKVLPTLFGLGYKSQWNTPWFFIREFYQNALDEHDEAKIKAIPKLERGSEGVFIEDQGRGLGAEALLMAETKAEAGDLRGRFGEGLKFACIVAVRMGYTPIIESKHGIIEAHSSMYALGGSGEKPVLTFCYKAAEKARTGTRVTIKGYHGETYNDRFTTFLTGKPLATAEAGTEGRFTRKVAVYDKQATSNEGRLYVGDIFIRALHSGGSRGADEGSVAPYSYNLWGLPLNPDRISEVDHSDLMGALSSPWSGIGEAEAIKLIKAVTTEDSVECGIRWDNMPEYSFIKSAWAKLFGKAIVYTSGASKKMAEGYGYTVLGENWTSQARSLFYNAGIEYDSTVVNKRVKELKPKIRPSSSLHTNQQRHLALVRLLASKFEGWLIPVEAADIPGDPRTDTETLGLCVHKESIYLSPKSLLTLEDALAVTAHEVGHWTGGSQAMDGTISHTRHVQEAGAKMAILIMDNQPEVFRILGRDPITPLKASKDTVLAALKTQPKTQPVAPGSQDLRAKLAAMYPERWEKR